MPSLAHDGREVQVSKLYHLVKQRAIHNDAAPLSHRMRANYTVYAANFTPC